MILKHHALFVILASLALQVDSPVSYEALLATGCIKNRVIMGMTCVRFPLKLCLRDIHLFFICNSTIFKVRLVSEEFSALLETRFSKDIPAIDLKFIRSFSSRNLHPSHPLGFSLALHTARFSTRISQDQSLLSDKSSTCVSVMMGTLLRAAGNPFSTPPNMKCFSAPVFRFY